MKLKNLIETFDFDDFFPELCVMYPNAKHHRSEFRRAFDILQDLQPQPSKNSIRYQLLEDPVSRNNYFGAKDECFKATWEILLGKEVSKDKNVDLNEIEIMANCLLNIIFLGKHPKEYDGPYQKLIRS